MTLCLLLYLPTWGIASPPAIPASKAPIELSLFPVAGGLSRPLLLTHAGDGSGRRFVVEQAGRILILVDSGPPVLFADLRSRVKSGGERGLLGLAFHPKFSSNRRLFVYYTDRSGDIVVGEMRASENHPNQADVGSLNKILTIANPASNHNGGSIAFGPDGFLYIGTGDGGGAGDPYQTAQNSYSHLGKILRIDVDARDAARPYVVPPGNPYVGRSTYLPEIWAYGLRNPWRMSFDRNTGDLFIGDVGQDHWEEINHLPAGKDGLKGGTNFGWSHMEGRHCFPPSKRKRCNKYHRPTVEYSHEGGHCSVTGGYVYRGTGIGKLNGVYLYGDYCSGTIWGLKRNSKGAYYTRPYLNTALHISSFGEDEAGELYVLDHRKGAVYRIVPLPE